MILGIMSVVTITDLFYIFVLLNVGGLVLGVISKSKGKLRTIGIILNSISLVIKVVFFILCMLSFAIAG